MSDRDRISHEREVMSHERKRLGVIDMRNGRLDGELAGRFAAVTARLIELVAVPPAGYQLPAAAAKFIEHTQAHGWRVVAQWSWDGAFDNPRPGTVFVSVAAARSAADPDSPCGWCYRYTWHSRGYPAGRLRLCGSGLAETPSQPRTHDAPSLRKAMSVIEQQPVKKSKGGPSRNRKVVLDHA